MRQPTILSLTLALTLVAGLATTAFGQPPVGAVVTAPRPAPSPPPALPNLNPLPLNPTLGGIPSAPTPTQTPAPVAAPAAPRR
jgi:hypothetical protein